MPAHSVHYTAKILPSENSNAIRLACLRDDAILSVEEVITGWCEDPVFRAAYNRLLNLDDRYPGYYWEHPPWTRDRLAEAYECILLPAQTLSRLQPDPTAFAEHFSREELVVHFSNLGGDAELVVPCPIPNHAGYAHLAPFVRSAPAEQQHAFWQRVGERCRALVGDRPRWLSTAGLGVSWLHVRLDTRPKYYKYSSYR